MLTYTRRMLALTPTTSKNVAPEEVRKICMDYTLNGIDTLKQLPRGNEGKPLRFVYASGAKAERDQTKRPWIMGDYTLLRVRRGAPTLLARHIANLYRA